MVVSVSWFIQTLKAEELLETSIGVTSSRLTRVKTGVIKAVSITIWNKRQGASDTYITMAVIEKYYEMLIDT